MKSNIRVVWLKNHGVRIITQNARGTSERFEPHAGGVTVAEACAALKSYRMKLSRLIEAGELKARKIAGVHIVPVAELWRLRRDRTALEDGRKHRGNAA